MKLAILSPTFPPKVCGVGDHAFYLSQALKKNGHSVEIYTQQKECDSQVAIEIENTNTIVKNLQRFKPEALIFQYTPYLYGGAYDLGTYLWETLSYAKSQKIKIVMLAHELHYPVNFSLAGLSIGPLQKWRFHKLFKISDQIIFTYELPYLKFKNSKKVQWLPVGSNIPVNTNEKNKSAWEKRQGIDENETVLFHFGGAHPTHLYDLVIESASLPSNNDKKIRVVCAGISQIELQKWNRSHDSLPKNLICLGKLPAEEISYWLERADIVLAPFMDGISERRGSAMAAFAHGKCVITTKGSSTTNKIPWEEFCIIAENNSKDFTREVSKKISDGKCAKLIGQVAKEFYNHNFQWTVLAERLVATISK